MKLKLIQSNCSSMNSIYIYENFLEDLDYLNLLKNKVEEYTHFSEMNYKTNVQAKMTDWKKLIDDNDFDRMHNLITHTLYNTLNLRNPTANENMIFTYVDSWGMRHNEGDYTKDHTHNFATFSGSFYFKVPSKTQMWFEDFQQDIILQDNMLVLFPGLCKHRVFKHTGEEPRYSMAFNIKIEVKK